MANYMHCVDGVHLEMSDSDHAARLEEERLWSVAAPVRAFGLLRRKRNKLLAETDYLALSDQTLSDDWKKYRSDLRNLPEQYDNSSVLGEITWPTKP